MLLARLHFVSHEIPFHRLFLINMVGSRWIRDTQKRVEMAEELEKWGKVTGWPVSIIADALSPRANTSPMTL